MEQHEKDLREYSIKGKWEIPFYNRERVPVECELFDSVNGVYPNDDIWEDTDIVLNLRASTDENGRVNDIQYYKVKDMTYGHGRPVSEDKELTLSDIKRFTEILSLYTLSRADEAIEPLLQKATNEGLPDGWFIKNINKTKVVFENKDGTSVSVPKKRIEAALEISYTYIDILFNPDFWDANTTVFKSEYKEPLLALFSLVDTSSYYHYEQLLEEANKRKQLVEKQYCYRLLCKAVESQNYAEVEKYASYAKEKLPYETESVPPLYYALKQGNRKIVKLLLENGASLSEEFFDNGSAKNALCGAIETENVSMLRQCLKEDLETQVLSLAMKTAQKEKRWDHIKDLLKKGAPLSPDSEFDDLSIEEILDLIKFNSISWHVEQIRRVYESGNIPAVKKMLKAAQYKTEPRIYVGKPYETWTSIWFQSEIISWIISVGDESLIKYCSTLKYSIDVKNWSELLQRPVTWAKPIKKMCLSGYDTSALGAMYTAIKKRDLAAVKKLIEHYDAQIDSRCIHCASTSREYNENWGPINEELLAYLIDHWQFPERFTMWKKAKRWEINSHERWDNGDFEWIFEGVIGKGSRELCMKLFEKIPEIFEIPPYIESMEYYVEHRKYDDDIKEIFNSIVSKKEK